MSWTGRQFCLVAVYCSVAYSQKIVRTKLSTLQASYWKCLKPFVELWGFDPYATPFTAEEALLLPPVSPTRAMPKAELSSSPRLVSESQLLLHKSGHSVSAGSLDVSRALQRSKINSQRQQVQI